MKSRDVVIELDGPDVSPDTVDPALFLPLADAWFRLMTKMAEGTALRLRGLRIEDKCIGAVSSANRLRDAQTAALRAQQAVGGRAPPPEGTETLVGGVRKAIRALPTGYSARVIVGPWSRNLSAPAGEVAEERVEVTELRVRPVRVGGSTPIARLSSASEEHPFSVSVSEDQARELGSLLYRPVDAELRLRRDADGVIVGGEILALHKIEEEATIDRWREWFAENTKAWDEVDDIAGELGRPH